MTYPYECTNKKCSNYSGFEIEASIKDEPLKECPSCGYKVNRVFKGTNVNLGFPGSYNSTRK